MRFFYFQNLKSCRNFIWCFWLTLGATYGNAATSSYDVVIYGGSSAGVVAAIEVSRLGKSVILIHPGGHIGGATTNGLGYVDCKNHKRIGGITREFFHNVWLHYLQEKAWVQEKMHPILDQQGISIPDDETLWVLEPHVGEQVFNTLLQAAAVPVVYHETLNRITGITKSENTLVAIEMNSGNVYRGNVFIDATYEGDLLAAAQVSYTIGREPNVLYGELHNGIQFYPLGQQKAYPINPYVVQENPLSGLLPRVFPGPDGINGTGDNAVQAYTYRLCLTDVTANQIPIAKPANYDEKEYEIVFRALKTKLPIDSFLGVRKLMPNRKTDTNNNGMISTDFVGMSCNWAEADDVTRQQIASSHENWIRGLIWTLQHHPRVPFKVRQFYAPWGLAKDEFVDNGNWPYELYVREGRRMISSVVITENTATGKENVIDGVGVINYEMDSHYVKYCVTPKQTLIGEGSFFLHTTPFSVSYQAIVPKKMECQNLLVPICVSASHVAFSAIRMEPQFMVLGQSAAAAAVLAIQLGVAVQDVPYDLLKTQLLNDGQILDP